MANEGSRAGYEFTAEQNDKIGSLGRKMRLVGLILLIFGLLNLASAIVFQVAYAKMSDDRVPQEVRDQLAKIGSRDRWIITGYMGVVGIVFAASGLWTRTAGGSFIQVVKTTGQDITHVMDGFSALHKMYSLIATLLVAAILAVLVLVFVKGNVS